MCAPQVARCLPWVLSNYKLEEITTVQELRSNVAKLFKLHAGVKNPGVTDFSQDASSSKGRLDATAMCALLLTCDRHVRSQAIDMLIYKGREELEVGAAAAAAPGSVVAASAAATVACSCIALRTGDSIRALGKPLT